MIYFRTYIFSFLLIAIAATGCVTYVKMSSENLAPSYQEDFQPLTKTINIVHRNDSISDLVFSLDASGFLFERDKITEPFKASATIRVVLFNSYYDARWTDSTGMSVVFEKDSAKPESLLYKLPLKINTGRKCIAYVSLRDDNKEVKQTVMLGVDKSDRLSGQWFTPLENISEIPSAFTCVAGSEVLFSYSGSDPEKLKCYYYGDSIPTPSPPYAFENIVETSLKPDSEFTVNYNSENKTFYFSTSETGIYFFTADPLREKGFTLICTDSGFPDINSHEAMFKPIRYISTQKEFNKIAEAANQVAAIEDFWLKIGGAEDHTRNLIRKYYSRVMNANRLFTSYTEGWQTDRGMIYIVFGPPNIVYRSDDAESWIYGEEKNFFSITFTFNKVKNIFCDNDYILQRAPVYKDNWFRAVDIWRQ